MLDPLDVFLRGTFQQRGLTPVPLISTDHDVVIASGLAVVITHRLFRNIEPGNIEAVLTFPLPVHATLYELIAEIDGRTLRAEAQERSAARQTYENAIERGKSAVLHEELLRGVHMMSIANIRPGGDIRITTRWAMPLSVVANDAWLRIPQTVGDVYGRSSLPDSDAILSGGQEQPVMVSIRSSGKIEIVGTPLVGGHARVKNAGPIDIKTELWEPKPIIGNSRSGHAIALTLSPQPAGKGALSAAVLVDHSGSMGGVFDNGCPVTIHDAAKQAIVSLAFRLRDHDFVDLWEFETGVTHVGGVGGDSFAADGLKTGLLKLAFMLASPRGGTEIGRAVDAVLRQSPAQDVLVITDGLSEALDVHRLARAGRRVSVILIGQSSFEAKIGHLAALTGGDIFTATTADLEQVTGAAIDGLRRRNVPLPQICELPDRLECVRNNLQMAVQWSPVPAEAVSPALDRAAVAIATSLVLSCATAELAGQVAAAEGIVSHLTSLVLVDEVGVIQEALPSLRKVPLAAPRTGTRVTFARTAPAMRPARSVPTADIAGDGFEPLQVPLFELQFAPRNVCREPAEPGVPQSRQPMTASEDAERASKYGQTREKPMAPFKAKLLALAPQIDWGQAAEDLVRGVLANLSPASRDAINLLAAMPEIRAFAARNDIDARAVVIGMLARVSANNDHRAKRVWLAIVNRLKGGASGSLWELEYKINSNLQEAQGA